jgi:release factor glutamine methyltransferase
MQDIWTIQRILNWTQDHFKKKQIPEARLSAELLLSHLLKIKRVDLYLQFERILTPAELAEYRNFVQRRAKSEPVQYITGDQDFMGLTFQVTRDTLIPRPETELLVESALEDIENFAYDCPMILDVGTGCGAIAVSIAHACKNCQITAIDSSEAAIGVARKNADLIGTQNIEFIVGDGLSFTPVESIQYHLIVTNPPYVSEKDYQLLHSQVRDYEPGHALLAGKTGTEFYQAFIPHAFNLLHPKGILLMEIGYNQIDEIRTLVSQSEFQNFNYILDYEQKPRMVRITR